ncbi:hypothetical protein BJV74DRAFT_797328 [Russula compacta]|nr:hypothetical protein BJV74DRAFT_797328 [Russula compacta]
MKAVGPFLKYCLESPGMPERSRACAHAVDEQHRERVIVCDGEADLYKEEGVMQWTWVLLDGMKENGRQIQDGVPESPRAGRGSVTLSYCVDDWENGGGEHMQRLIRKVSGESAGTRREEKGVTSEIEREGGQGQKKGTRAMQKREREKQDERTGSEAREKRAGQRVEWAR